MVNLGLILYVFRRIAQLSAQEVDVERLTVSVEEAAHALGVSRAHAFRMAGSGELPTIRLGKRLLVPIDALNKLVAAVKVPAGAG